MRLTAIHENTGNSAFLLIANNQNTSGSYSLPISGFFFVSGATYKLRAELLSSPNGALLATAVNLFTVTGPTASANNSSQLASALVALESALKSILQLLGQ